MQNFGATLYIIIIGILWVVGEYFYYEVTTKGWEPDLSRTTLHNSAYAL